jgi:UDP-3-O-[3-hydroxymyristoyl] glucosamine N-acyltransferase
MHLSQPTTAAQLADRLSATLIGDGELVVTGINEIHHVEQGDLTFVDFHKYYDVALSSAATVILIDQIRPCPPGKALLVVDEPFRVYNGLVLAERPERRWSDTVDPSAIIGAGTSIAAGAIIGPGAVIGANCRINANAVIGEGVVLEDNVVVGAGAVIGEEAFYFKKTAEGFVPWRSGGSVLLESDVEIGPNCTVARGVSSVTTIGRGTKLDAQVQIGHDCRIGVHCIIAAQVGIAGNTTVGDWCVFQGQVGIAQNLTIGDRTIILAKSGVSKSLEGDKEYFGYPAQEARTAFKDLAVLRRLRKK